jgi:hypothetical protein
VCHGLHACLHLCDWQPQASHCQQLTALLCLKLPLLLPLLLCA